MPLFVSSHSFYPVVGKVNGLRDALSARVRDLQSQGRRRNLIGPAGVSHEGPMFQMTGLYDSLAEFEAAGAVPIPQAVTDAFTPLLARQSGELLSVVVEPPVPAQGAAARPVIHRMRFTPMPGELAAVRDLFAGRVNETNAAGARGALSVTLTGRPQLLWTRWFESLAQWEEVRAKMLADPKGAAFVAKTKGLMFEPPLTQIFRIVVPYAPA